VIVGGSSVVEGSTIALDGSASSDVDGSIVAYAWSVSAGAVLDDAGVVSPMLTGVDDATVTVTLTVTDDDGGTATVTSTVTVSNAVPVVDPAGPLSATVGEVFTLPTSFTDAGTLDTHVATVDWGDGSPVDDLGAVVSPFDATHTFTAAGVYTVTVTVTDDDGGVGAVDIQVEVVEVNRPPVAVDDFVVTDEDTPVTVAVLANDVDPDGDVLSVTAVSVPANGAAVIDTDGTIVYTPNANFNGVDSFTYTIDDGWGGTDTATVSVTVNDVNDDPVAVIVGGSSVVEGSTIALDGSGSSDVDGTIVAYAWSVSAGAVLDDAGVVSPLLTGVDDATVTVTLTVTDDDGGTATTTSTVTVSNAVPVVDPAGPLSATVGEVFTLPTSFTDAGTLDTHVATVDWGDGSPVDDLGAVVSPFDATHTYAAAGVYTVTVSVIDDDGGVGTTEIQVEVVDAGTLTSLELTPSTAVVGTRIWQSFTAEGFDAAGNSLGDFTAEAVFTISPNGTCTLNACRSGTTGLKVVTAQVGTIAGTATLDVRVRQTISFPTISRKTMLESPVLVTATASSGLPVTFTTTTPDVCVAGGENGSSITLIGPGTCTVRADQAGDDTWAPAVPVSRNFAVRQVAQTITFPSLTTTLITESPVVVSATASSGLPVTFTTTTPTVCTAGGADGSSITLLDAGRCTVRAEQSGDPVYLAARPVNRSFTVTLPPPEVLTFTASPTLLSAAGGSVELSGTAVWAATCRFTVSPALAGFPLAVPCTGGSASATATIPANTRTTSRTYTFGFSALRSGATTDSGNPIAVRVAPASEPVVDLSISATSSADPAVVGQPLTYTFTVINAGPDLASVVDFTSTLPSGATFVSATATQGAACVEASGIVSCALGDVANGGSADVTIVVVPNTPGAESITASVSSTATDADPANDETTIDSLFVNPPRGIITPAQPFATADPARRHVGNRAFELADGGFMVVGASFPASGQQYGTSFFKLDEDLRTDYTFGVDGVLNRIVPAGFFPSNVVLDEDGGVLTLGGDFSIIRHREDGTLDLSFGGDGRSDAPTPPANFALTAMFEATRQPDGKIVAIGWAVENGNFNHQYVAAVRYNADGTVDTDFATDGVALLEATWPSPSCSSNDPNTRLRPNQLLVQPDGKILIAGSHHWCGLTRVSAMRLLPDGTWDPAFGINGLSISTGLFGAGEGQSVWLEDGGGFTVAGSRIYGGSTGVGGVIHRYRDNGTLDTTFGGGDGRLEVGQGLVRPQAVGRDLDGSYYFAGNETSGSTARLVVLRADADGVLDTTFGTDGRMVEAVGPIGSYGARSVISLSNGAVGVAGFSGISRNGDVAAFHRFE
jgi:uncharacterized delta-60 repeat protein/uncharacterized repeat protein (TIGR01451 family)